MPSRAAKVIFVNHKPVHLTLWPLTSLSQSHGLYRVRKTPHGWMSISHWAPSSASASHLSPADCPCWSSHVPHMLPPWGPRSGFGPGALFPRYTLGQRLHLVQVFDEISLPLPGLPRLPWGIEQAVPPAHCTGAHPVTLSSLYLCFFF